MKTQKFLTNFREEQLAIYQEAIRTNPQPEVEFLITRGEHVIIPTDYSLERISEGEDLEPFWNNFRAIQKKEQSKTRLMITPSPEQLASF